MELRVAGPVVTPVPGQPEVAYDWWLSAPWTPPTPVKATEWRVSLMSGQVVALFGYDPYVNWPEVGPCEITAAMVEYARIGLAADVPPVWSPRRRGRSGSTPPCGASNARRAAPFTYGRIVVTTEGIALAP